jgi:vancomycin permeability regulator SanA
MAKLKFRLSKLSLITLGITSVNISVLFYSKFKYSGISIGDYSFLATGNLINIIFYVLFFAGLIFQKKVKSKIEHVVLILSVINLFLLILPSDIYFVSESYLFGSPVHKVISAFQYLLFEFLFLLQIAFLYLTFFHVNHIIYLKGFLFSSNIFLVLFIFTYLYILKSPIVSEENLKEENSIGVVLGAAVWSDNNPSPLFQSRIKKAFILLKDKKINKILLMGGRAPGEISEAKAAFKMLKELGVDQNKLIAEEKTTTTFEQIKYLADKKLFKEFKNIIIISDSFHLARVKEMSEFVGLNTIQIPSGHKLKWEKLLYFRLRETFALLFFWLFGI